MNTNNFTIKAQEILQAAQQVAYNAQSPAIESSHLLKALLDDKEGPISYILKKVGVNTSFVEGKLEDTITRGPKVSGDAAQNLSREANNALLRAGAILKEFGDEFVTPEHILLGII